MNMAIEARGLVKTYPAPGKKKDRVRALDGLDLNVPRGTIYAVLGPNGAGKTTAVIVLTTLAWPDSGAAAVEGTDVLAHPAKARQAIGVVAQRSGADPTATGRENLTLQGLNASVAEQAVSTTVQTLIIVFLGLAGGARYPGGVAGVVVLTVASVLIGVLWGALSNMTGMLLRSREAIIGVYTFFMLPLMFLSSAFMRPSFLPGWMQAIASRNPLNWEVQVGRSALSANPDWSAIAVRSGGLLVLAVICVAIAVTTFRSYAKNV